MAGPKRSYCVSGVCGVIESDLILLICPRDCRKLLTGLFTTVFGCGCRTDEVAEDSSALRPALMTLTELTRLNSSTVCTFEMQLKLLSSEKVEVRMLSSPLASSFSLAALFSSTFGHYPSAGKVEPCLAWCPKGRPRNEYFLFLRPCATWDWDWGWKVDISSNVNLYQL